MNLPAKGSCLLGWALVVALLGPAARAAEKPLLVVVEASPALDADAGEIRRAIGAELRCQTIAPMKTMTEPPERALIVAIDDERIAMSLRSSDGPPVTRFIPAPADRAARLRAIAWLAGNLARDQVSPILAETPGGRSPLATIPALPTPPLATEPPPAPTAPPPAAAPPSSLPPPSDPGGAAISIRGEPQRPPDPLRWSISGSLGPVIATWLDLFGFQPSTAWQLTVERRREHKQLVIGGTLEGTYNHDGNGNGPQLFGADVFVGANWRYRYCNLEATLGAGPEAANVVKPESVAYGNPTMNAPYYISVYHFGLYAQGTIAAAIPLSGSVEALLQLGVHLSSSYGQNWFAASTIGVRYTLP